MNNVKSSPIPNWPSSLCENRYSKSQKTCPPTISPTTFSPAPNSHFSYLPNSLAPASPPRLFLLLQPLLLSHPLDLILLHLRLLDLARDHRSLVIPRHRLVETGVLAVLLVPIRAFLRFELRAYFRKDSGANAVYGACRIAVTVPDGD